MDRNRQVILAIFVLALAALACNAATGGGGGGDDPAGPTATPSPRVILSDDFSSSQWGTGTDADSSVEYASSALQIRVERRIVASKKVSALDASRHAGALDEVAHCAAGGRAIARIGMGQATRD